MTSPALAALATAAGSAALVGLTGLLAVAVLARRSVAAAVVAAPLVVVAAIAAAVWVTVRAMFISQHDAAVVLLVLAGAAPVAVGFGVMLAVQVQRLTRGTAGEAAARQRDREVEVSRRRLITWVSHDLRTPLAGIKAMVEALEDGVTDDPGRYHRMLRSEIDRMAHLLDDLLELSRIHDGALHLRLAATDLSDLVSDTIAASQPVAREQGVRVTGRADGALIAPVDARALTRVLANLTLNAVQHTPAGGTVRVDAFPGDGAALLRVTDQCGGIPTQLLPRVFEAGVSGSTARSPGHGTGVGLAVVRGLVSAHGGTVDVRNVAGGCRFQVRMPLGTATRDRHPGDRGASSPWRSSPS